MNLTELIESGANISVSLSAKDLKVFADQVMYRAKELARIERSAQCEELLTAEEVMILLKVSKATLWRWNRDNILPCLKIGGEKRYKRSDIEKLCSK